MPGGASSDAAASEMRRVSFRSPLESPVQKADAEAAEAAEATAAGSASGDASTRQGSSAMSAAVHKVGQSRDAGGSSTANPLHAASAAAPIQQAAPRQRETPSAPSGAAPQPLRLNARAKPVAQQYQREMLHTPPPGSQFDSQSGTFPFASNAGGDLDPEGDAADGSRAPLDGKGTNAGAAAAAAVAAADGISRQEMAFMEMSMAARLGEGVKRKSPRHNAKVPLGAEAEMGLPGYVEERFERHMSYYTQTVVLIIVFAAMANNAWVQVSASLEDGNWIRMANVAWIPCIVIFMLFSVHFAITQLVCSFGPVAHMQTNSKFYSAIAPPRPLHYPMVTIQMPVYKEGLEATIMPSIVSLEAAMTHYKKAGGVSRIYINDDGLQLLSDKERSDRVRAYNAHGIGYVARPGHDKLARKGLFKKASNMNYALDVTFKVERIMAEQGITDVELALDMVKTSMDGEFIAGGDVRIGEIILLVDSDTRVPEDCLTKIVGEFALAPQLGFLQCRTTPLRDQDNYWEDMIAHFTANIYDVGIALSVSAGDPAPLVGHNAFLRWDAIKAGSWVDSGDPRQQRKFWSEHHVSEDFDMSLRMQTLGYIGRYCTYTGPGFQEGVSLTAADEVIRLRKYAFGACEMMLNRFKDWPCKGPITGMFWSYLSSPAVPWPAKLQMTGYLGTYLAMAYSIYGLCIYILLRMFYPLLQESTTNTFDVFMTVLVLFGLIGMFGAGIIRYRMGYSTGMTIFGSWFIEIKNAPAMTIFWSHVMWHITTACWSYFWDMPIVWGATLKEVENGSFWFEFTSTLKRYRGMYASLALMTGVFSGLMWYREMPWDDMRLTFPFFSYVGFHTLGPFLLNPNILRGYY